MKHNTISKYEFGRLFGLLCQVAFLPEHAVAAFRKSGLFPLNKQMLFDQGKFIKFVSGYFKI